MDLPKLPINRDRDMERIDTSDDLDRSNPHFDSQERRVDTLGDTSAMANAQQVEMEQVGSELAVHAQEAGELGASLAQLALALPREWSPLLER